MPKAKTFAGAKQVVYRLLKIRIRSEKEVRDKLKEKEFDQLTIDQTLDYFKGINFINDETFAKAWIESRALRPFGINRIRFELKKKGIADDVILEQLNTFKNAFPEEDIVFNLAQRRKELSREKDPVKVKERIYGFLLRKGFNVATVLKVIKKI